MGSDGKSQRFLFWGFSSEARLALANSFPQKRSNLPAWIRSRMGSVVQLNASQAFELGHRSRFITTSYLLGALADSTPPSRESLVWDKDLLLAVVRRRNFCRRVFSCGHPVPPPERPGRRPGPVVAAQLGVMQQVPHEPNLRDAEAVNDHEFSVETGVKRLKVRGSWRAGDPEGPESLVAQRLDANQLEAHSQKDVIDGEQLHLWGKVRLYFHLFLTGKIKKEMYLEICVTCWQAELSLRAVCPDMTNPPPPA